MDTPATLATRHDGLPPAARLQGGLDAFFALVRRTDPFPFPLRAASARMRCVSASSPPHTSKARATSRFKCTITIDGAIWVVGFVQGAPYRVDPGAS
jgi:hypothetical protein